jgi:zinc protease
VAAATADRAATLSTLANGARLVVRERVGAPAVSIGVYFAGGRSAESSADAGVTQLATGAIRRGTARRSGEQIDREFEFLGTQLGTDVANDWFGVTLDVVAANLRPALDLVADVVLHPSFPEAGVAEERALQLAAIRRSFDSSTQRPIALAFRDLYDTHPYALAANGNEASVTGLGAADLAAWWRRFAVAEGALILVVGDVEADAARRLVESAFSALPARAVPAPPLAAPPPPATRTEMVEFRDRKQSAIAMTFAAAPPGDADAVPLRLLEAATSGLAGTLFAELRGRRSLAYTVFCGYLPRREGGALLAYLATDAGKELEARTALLAELRRLSADGLTEADFERAQESLAGSTRIELQTNGALLADYARNLLLGRELDATARDLERARAVTLDQLREVAGRYLGVERFATAVLRGKS